MEAKLERLAAWLRTSDAYDVLDNAVLGCLPMSEVEDLAADYDLPVWAARAAIGAALTEGN